MKTIADRINTLKEALPPEVTLVAVSKTKPASDIMEAYETGHRDFGENRVQELLEKQEALPEDIRWHMIGHLQRNKVKYLVDFVYLIHGVDSVRLLREINKRAAKAGKTADCLLQVHIAEESSKFGFDEAELRDLFESDAAGTYPNVRLRGLMGMATFTEDREKIRREFRRLRSLYDAWGPQMPHADTLSMGMSGDYDIAIEEGSNMIRVGSRIFGARN